MPYLCGTVTYSSRKNNTVPQNLLFSDSRFYRAVSKNLRAQAVCSLLAPSDRRGTPVLHQARLGFLVNIGKWNTIMPEMEWKWVPLQFHFANFFKFMAANLSFTQFLAWAKPVYLVYRIPCGSLASALALYIFFGTKLSVSSISNTPRSIFPCSSILHHPRLLYHK